MNDAVIQSISKLINEKQTLIQPELKNGRFNDYASLKTAVVELELEEEISLLSVQLHSDPEGFSDWFIQHFIARERSNAGTGLSFFTLANGACNELYWQVARLLFPQHSMGQLMSLLFPDVTHVVTPEFNLNASTKLTTDRIKITYTSSPIVDAFPDEPVLSDLQHVVIKDNLLFDARTIERFDFSLHTTHYETLHLAYPDLANRLYQHNYALRKLRNEILMVIGNDQTPLNMFQSCIYELTLGGSKYTGSEFAARHAQKAVASFLEYLQSLPTDFAEAILALRDNRSIDDVKEHLLAGKCVEEAALDLQKIIQKPANQALLTSHPRISRDYVEQIREKYRPASNKKLSTTFDSNNIQLPQQFLQRVLNTIYIDSPSTLLDFLLAFPTEFYTPLLSMCNLPLLYAFDVFRRETLNQEQVAAYNQAILNNAEKLGSYLQLVEFAMYFANTQLFKALLLTIPEEERLNLFKIQTGGGYFNWYYTLAIYIAFFPQFMPIIFELLPKQHRIEAITDINFEHANILHKAFRMHSHYVARDFEIADYLNVLHAVPESYCLDLLKQKNKRGDTVLHVLAACADVLIPSLLLYPEETRLAAVNEKNLEGKTVLHKAVLDKSHLSSKTIRAILAALPEKDRLAAVSETNAEGDTILHLVSHDPELVEEILQLYPQPDRVAVLNRKNTRGQNVLHLAAGRLSGHIMPILTLYPEELRTPALLDKDNLGNTVFQYAGQYSGAVKEILQLIPETEQLNLLENVDSLDREQLHIAARDPESLKVILSMYLPEKRLERLLRQDKQKESVIDRVDGRLTAILTILELLPIEDRLAVLNYVKKDGFTVFYSTFTQEQAFEAVQKLVAPADLLDAMKMQCLHGYTPLHKVADDTKLFPVFLAHYPESERWGAMQQKNGHGRIPIQGTLFCNPSIPTLLKLLPPNRRLEYIIQKRGMDGMYPIHATNNPERIQALLESLTPEERCMVVNLREKYGHTALHSMASYPKALRVAMNLLPPAFSESAVQELDNNNNTVLHLAVKNPEAADIILQRIPPDKWLDTVKKKNNDQESVLLKATANPKSFQLILSIYSDEEQLDAVNATDIHGLTALHRSVAHLETFTTALNVYPAQNRHQAIQTKSLSGNTVLHEAVQYPETFKAILEFYPEDRQFGLLTEKNNEGQTVLHAAIKYPDQMPAILASLHGSCRFLSVIEKNSITGKNVLQSAVSQHRAMKAILSSLSPEACFAAVNDTNQNGDTTLHSAAALSSPFEKKWAIETILPFYPQDKRLALATQQNREGKTALDWVTSSANLDALVAILQLLPRKDRAAALNDRSNEGVTLYARAKQYSPAYAETILTLLFPEDLADVKAQASVKINRNQFFSKTADAGTSASGALAYEGAAGPKQ